MLYVRKDGTPEPEPEKRGRGRPSTVDLDQLRRLVESGYTQVRIAEELGKSIGTVKYHLYSAQFAARRKKPGPEPVLGEDDLRRRVAEGQTAAVIAQECGVSRWCVYKSLQRAGIRAPAGRPIDPAEVRRLVESGLTRKQVARTLRVAECRLQATIREHLPDLLGSARTPAIPDSDVDRVAEWLRSGWLESEVAMQYGVNQTTVSHFVTRHGLATSNGRGRRRNNGKTLDRQSDSC